MCSFSHQLSQGHIAGRTIEASVHPAFCDCFMHPSATHWIFTEDLVWASIAPRGGAVLAHVVLPGAREAPTRPHGSGFGL